MTSDLARIDRCTRSGAVTLELVIAFPVFVMLVMSIVAFGILLSNEVYVVMSSRAGTQVASNIVLSETDGDPVPPNVLNAVKTVLSQIGIVDYTVELEHNIDFDPPNPVVVRPVVTLKSVVGTGPVTVNSPPPIVLSPNLPYVRVTVSVHSSELTPNVLATYGIDLSTRVSDATTLRRFAQ